MINESGAISSSAKFDGKMYRNINGRNLILFSVFFLVFLMLLVIECCNLGGDDLVYNVIIIVCTAVACLGAAIVVVSILLTIKKVKSDDKYNVVEIYEDLMRITEYEKGAKISVEHCFYNKFVKVKETKKYFLAYLTVNTMHPISKEGMSVAEQNTVRRLLRLRRKADAGEVQLAYSTQNAPTEAVPVAAEGNAAQTEKVLAEERRSIKATGTSYAEAQAAFSGKFYIFSVIALIVGVVGLAAYFVLTVAYGVMYDEVPSWVDAFLVFAVPFALGLVFVLTARQQKKTARVNADLTKDYEFFSDCFVMREYRNGAQVSAVKFRYEQIVKTRQKGNYLILYYMTMSVVYPVDISRLTEAECNTLKKLLRMPLPDGAKTVELAQKEEA